MLLEGEGLVVRGSINKTLYTILHASSKLNLGLRG
jgi:hypothetical protein